MPRPKRIQRTLRPSDSKAGEILRRARLLMGVDIRDVAQRLSILPRGVRALETRACLRWSSMAAYAAALGLESVDDLFLYKKPKPTARPKKNGPST